jgi:hypothetical protein
MKPNAQYIRKLEEGTPLEVWYVDMVGCCGDYLFKDVIQVVDPLSGNPGVVIALPTGIRGIKRALQLIDQTRKDMGLPEVNLI